MLTDTNFDDEDGDDGEHDLDGAKTSVETPPKGHSVKNK
jgi:hypothetical protein